MSATFHKTIFEGMPNAAMVLDTKLVFVDANEAYCQAVQRKKSDLIGNYVFDVFPDTPERIAPIKAVFEQTLSGKATRMEAQPYKLELADGTVEDRIWQISQFPIRCEKGEVEFLVQRAEDVTEREELRRQRDLVTAELHHRVRNSLAVVQSIADHTAQTTTDVESFLKSFNGRLAAMSRNFEALTEAHWSGLDFESVMRTELEPYAGPALDRVTIEGEPIKLTVRASKTTSMFVHEMVTNACKYGFLSCETGRLHARWWIEDKMLCAEWHESGLQDLSPPTETGFGFQLFGMMPNMNVQHRFESDGLKLSFRVPVSVSVASGEVSFEED
nr:HWE histidine kinase domain-containing protein [Hyphomonas sp. Mor2]